MFLSLFIFFILLFAVPFLQAGRLWFLFIVESAPCGWGWTSGLSRFAGQASLCLYSGGWSWISSLKCNKVSSSEFWIVFGFGVALGSLSFGAQGCVPALLEN